MSYHSNLDLENKEDLDYTDEDAYIQYLIDNESEEVDEETYYGP